MSELKRTSLHQYHVDSGARMVPFGGWDMPVQYKSGIITEHKQCREKAALFDCSHMGQFRLKGPNVVTDLDKILPRNVSKQKTFNCRYNFLLNEDGGVIDDLIVYKLSETEFYLVVNAGTHVAIHLAGACPRIKKCDIVKYMAYLAQP